MNVTHTMFYSASIFNQYIVINSILNGFIIKKFCQYLQKQKNILLGSEVFEKASKEII